MPLQDTFRLYDNAVRDWVRSFVTEGNPVETVFATPDRPFGRYKSMDEFRSVLMKQNIIVSVTRLDPVYNPALRIDTPIIPVAVARDRSSVLGSQYPRPYLLPYQVDLRARRRTAANLWLQWIYFTMNPYHVFKIDFGSIWSIKNIHALLDSIVDNSDLETGENERFIRWTVTLHLIAFMFPVPENVDTDVPDPFGMLQRYKTVKDAQVDIYDSVDPKHDSDPASPDNHLVDVIRRKGIEGSAELPVESEGE